MSTEMNATETVRNGQRWEPCGSSGCGWWSRRDAEGNEVEHRPLGDPLADTPEGWWEFGQILEWAEWSVQWDVAMSKVFDSMWRLEKGVGNQFRAAFIEALAEAVGGQGESMKEARE